ncbi:hypothetical protein HYT02_01320 [Candidatus Gottesmanbacteria bacterium]|nr:hypothetical protein [Candidatus Gottesmanbacteria bacterium]
MSNRINLLLDMSRLPKLSSTSQYIVSIVIFAFLMVYIFVLARQTFFDTAQAESESRQRSQILIATPSGRLEKNDLFQKTQKKILIFMGILQKNKSDTATKMNEKVLPYFR